MITGNFPHTRLRRSRQAPWIRNLTAETTLTPNDLIWPIFVRSPDSPAKIEAMPGVLRYAIEELPRIIEEISRYQIPAVALFPYTPHEKRSPEGIEALNPDNLICQAIRKFKQENAAIGVLTDVALDPYTDHGHDGVIFHQDIDNDKTIEILCQQALNQAQAGADAVAPSDMMDGRIQLIRQHLDAHGFQKTLIISYAAKYASGFYGPFRQAVGVEKLLGPLDKKTYQMNPSNTDEALREVAMDIQEGADAVIIKPGLPYLDIIQRTQEKFSIPIFAYQVSGEYAMIQAAAQNGWIDGARVMQESLLCLKRAGASAILTYAALEMAKTLTSTLS
jgi:porphobilinogen synthase